MKNLYKLGPVIEAPIIDEKTLLFSNWYVKPLIQNKKRHILFLEKETFFSVWCLGVTSKNISGVFKENFKEALRIAGIKNEKIKTLDIDTRETIFSKTSDKRWIGVSNEISSHSEYWFPQIQQTTSELVPLILYRANTGLYGGPNYKWPEDEVRKFFGLERRKDKADVFF